MHSIGFDTIFYPLENGERRAAFSAFLEPCRDRETLVIRKYAHVNKVRQIVSIFHQTYFSITLKTVQVNRYKKIVTFYLCTRILGEIAGNISSFVSHHVYLRVSHYDMI